MFRNVNKILRPNLTGSASSILKRGSRGPEVLDLQKRLGIKQDGIFGPHTEAAVRDFQRIKRLVSDGIVGPQTQSALFGASKAGPQIYTVKHGDTLSGTARAVWDNPCRDWSR